MQDLDQKVEQALACPCLDEMKEGPCGSSFITAFSCFLKSRANEKVCVSLPKYFCSCTDVCLLKVEQAATVYGRSAHVKGACLATAVSHCTSQNTPCCWSKASWQ